MKKLLIALIPAILSRVLRARKAKNKAPGSAGGTTRS